MTDHFDGIQKLKDPVAGCQNFRRVPGYKVYVCGQPTIAGLEAVLTKVCEKPIPTFAKTQAWCQWRTSLCQNFQQDWRICWAWKYHQRSKKKYEPDFLTVCQGRASANGSKLKVVDISKKESEVEVKEMYAIVYSLSERFFFYYIFLVSPSCSGTYYS